MRKIRTGTQAGIEPRKAFKSDYGAMARCSQDGTAQLFVRDRPSPGVALGRFHRMPGPALAGEPGCTRRLTGGKAVAVGPGIVELVVVAPNVDWFDPSAASLRPDQILNRALRPVLAVCRDLGVDVFYPGRDLLTVAGKPLAHASFTVTPDGVCIVEVQIADTASFQPLASLLERADPAGVAAVARKQFNEAVMLKELSGRNLGGEPQAWLAALAPHLATTFNAEVEPMSAQTLSGQDVLDGVDVGGDSAFDAFIGERRAAPTGHACAVAESMLGVVEVTAKISGGCIHELMIAGDLIAPFHTLEAITECCEGQPLRPPVVRRALAKAMTRRRSFVLGYNDFDELIMRLDG